MNTAPASLLLLLYLCASASGGKYTRHRLVSFVPQDVKDVHLFTTVLRLQGSNKNPLKLDLWSERVQVGKEFLLRVPPESFGRFRRALLSVGLQFRVNLHDIQEEIDRQATRHAQHQEAGTGMPLDLEQYHGYDAIVSFVDSLGAECGSRCTVSTVGRSTEGRDIRMIKITGSSNSAATAVFVDSTIHAREWITPNTVLWIIRSFVRDYGTRAEVTAAVDRFDWYFIPVVNPDGYEFTRSAGGDRMWRKTRSDNPSEPLCPGTDGNRNFDFQWGGIGSSDDPCSNTYRGSQAFSEPETRAVRDALQSVNKPLTCYTAVHSHGEYWLSRWGYTYDLPPNSQEMDRVGQAVADRIFEFGGQSEYTVGPGAITLYPASGGSGDYFYGVGGATYSYVVELPGRGYGFLLPEEEIRDIAEETLEGYLTMARELQVSQ